MFVLFVQVFVFYYGMFCDCLTSRQIIVSLTLNRPGFLKSITAGGADSAPLCNFLI